MNEVATTHQQPSATRATSDDQLLESWLARYRSPNSRRAMSRIGGIYLDALAQKGLSLRTATIEDTRDAIGAMTDGMSESTVANYTRRIKSLISYAHTIGYTRFNAGSAISVAKAEGIRPDRILSEMDVALLIRATTTERDRLLLSVMYAAGLRVAEVTSLYWQHVMARDSGQAQLSVRGKGDKRRQVLLPIDLSRDVFAFREGCRDDDAVFRAMTRQPGGPIGPRLVNLIIKQAAAAAGLSSDVSPHWLRHAHASHAIDRGARLNEIQATMGHGNISTTSGYLHAKPDSSSGLVLDSGIFGSRKL
jgi:site-specific recombinase XerD